MNIRACCPPAERNAPSEGPSKVKCYGYLDIETTGLTYSRSQLTVVGVAAIRGTELQFGQLVGDQIDADGVMRLLDGVDEMYTYNGSRFDLPFIRARLNLDLRRQFTHTDLMYKCWLQNLKGGLKVVETKLGIARQLPDVNGFMAVRLWWMYVNGHNAQALQTLLEYNKEDVLNLHILREKLGVM